MNKLNSEVENLLKRVEEAKLPSIESYDPSDARVEFSRRLRVLETEGEQIYKVIEFKVNTKTLTIPCRLYQYSEDNNIPLVIFAHGGGWVLGGLEDYDSFCRRLAKSGGCNIISIGYRLAPENPHPAAFDDVLNVFLSLDQIKLNHNIKPSSIIGAGDSAGGNLIASASVSLPADKQPKGQILIYPVIDASKKRKSYEEFGDKFLLDTSVMDWFIESYCSNSSRDNPDISIILSPKLHKSPNTFVMTAGLDPLRDEGLDFVKKLRKSSVSVTHSHYPDMLHGFLGMPKALSQYIDAFGEIGIWIKKIDNI